jgi:hypothetical protein
MKPPEKIPIDRELKMNSSLTQSILVMILFGKVVRNGKEKLLRSGRCLCL